MSQTCPRCGYERKPSDSAPDWQCPSCEKAYGKAGSAPEARLHIYTGMPERRSGGGKWLLLLLVLGAALWFGRPLIEKRLAPPPVVQAEQPEVILYATDWCGYCKKTRQFFAANGIRYTERDIEKSSAALREHDKLGQGVPIVVVGNEVVQGFNEIILRKLLKPWLKP